MPDWQTLALIGAVFILAGGVKGVLGFGLPMVSLGLLAAALGLQTAITLMLLPSLATNLWQATSGGYAAALARRLWHFFLAAAACIWAGTFLLSHQHLSSSLLGAVFIAYAIASLRGVRLTIAPARERRGGVLFGAVNGAFTGMTGNFAFPGVLFLQGIGLPREQLVQAMGILFSVSTLVLGLVMFSRGLLVVELNAISAAAILPALIGMALGRRLRLRLSEAKFRQVFYIGILLLGAALMVKHGVLIT